MSGYNLHAPLNCPERGCIMKPRVFERRATLGLTGQNQTHFFTLKGLNKPSCAKEAAPNIPLCNPFRVINFGCRLPRVAPGADPGLSYLAPLGHQNISFTKT